MGKIGLLKRGCLAFGLLFGCVFGGSVVDAQMAGITQDGCYFARTNQSDFNVNPATTEFAPTNEPWCSGGFTTQPVLEINSTNPEFSSAGGWSTPGYNITYSPPVYNLAVPSACKKFFGRTNDNPVIDQGVIDFDNDDPDDLYRTCLGIVAGPADEIRFDMDGWAWNTNLGWFSMTGFDNGSGQLQNRGVDYGNAGNEFASEIRIENGVDKFDDGLGEFYGYWWNDTAGWLKLNCEGDTALNATDSDNCAADGGADYGVYVVSFDAATGRAVLGGSAWSDSVGYIDFQGVQVELPALSVDYRPEVKYVPVDGNGDELSNEAVVRAASESGYKIEIRFKDGVVNKTDEFANEDFKNSFCLSYRDLRLLDEMTGQLVSSSDRNKALRYSCNTSTSVANLRANEDDVNMNNLGWDAADDGVIMTGVSDRFTYDASKNAFVSNNYIRSRIPVLGSRLRLDNIFMRNGISGAIKSLNTSQFDLINSLSFGNPFEMNFVGGQVGDRSQCLPGELTVDFENPMDVSFCGTLYNDGGVIRSLNASILGQPTVNDAYSDQFDSVTATLDREGRTTFRSLNVVTAGDPGDVFGSSEFWLNLNLANGVEPADLDPVKSLLNLSVSSVVDYVLTNGTVVKRLGPTLADDSQNIFELNIQGGLIDRSFGSSTFSTGSKDTLGVSEGVKVKERVYRVLRNILALKPGRCGSLNLENVNRSDLVKSLSACPRVSQSNGQNVIYIGSSGESRVGEYVAYSELKELIVNQSLNGKAPVIVLYGIDLILDEDNLSQSFLNEVTDGNVSDVPASVLGAVPGLVVVENSETREGGEVIVSAEDVTDFVGYIYADGRMMSAPDKATSALAAQGNADAVLNRGAMSKENLYNQFSFFGTLYSSNCIGCASNSPALRADGSVAESRALSLNDDLNAFRYTPLRFRIESGVYEFDTGFGTSEVEYSCYVPCGVGFDSGDVDAWVENTLFTTTTDERGNETRTFNQNECSNFSGTLNASQACYDTDRYTVGTNRLSEIEEALASVRMQQQNLKPSGSIPVQVEVARDLDGGDYSSVRSVNIRPLEVPAGMPVFGAISE
jgi:hypothetical protein